jgi:hypothetical protein
MQPSVPRPPPAKPFGQEQLGSSLNIFLQVAIGDVSQPPLFTAQRSSSEQPYSPIPVPTYPSGHSQRTVAPGRFVQVASGDGSQPPLFFAHESSNAFPTSPPSCPERLSGTGDEAALLPGEASAAAESLAPEEFGSSTEIGPECEPDRLGPPASACLSASTALPASEETIASARGITSVQPQANRQSKQPSRRPPRCAIRRSSINDGVEQANPGLTVSDLRRGV